MSVIPLFLLPLTGRRCPTYKGVKTRNYVVLMSERKCYVGSWEGLRLCADTRSSLLLGHC